MNITIIDVNVMNISLINMEGNFEAVDADDYSCHGYCIITFSSSLYTPQEDFSIYGQVISSIEMVCEVTYLFLVNINSHYYVLQKQIR